MSRSTDFFLLLAVAVPVAGGGVAVYPGGGAEADEVASIAASALKT